MQQHAEDSVGTIKALFESTYAKAVWHRPSLIVFDDLDKVVGAELEVQLLHHLHRTQITLIISLPLALRFIPFTPNRCTFPRHLLIAQ